jgi:hypothetical protein
VPLTRGLLPPLEHCQHWHYCQLGLLIIDHPLERSHTGSAQALSRPSKDYPSGPMELVLPGSALQATETDCPLNPPILWPSFTMLGKKTQCAESLLYLGAHSTSGGSTQTRGSAYLCSVQMPLLMQSQSEPAGLAATLRS